LQIVVKLNCVKQLLQKKTQIPLPLFVRQAIKQQNEEIRINNYIYGKPLSFLALSFSVGDEINL